MKTQTITIVNYKKVAERQLTAQEMINYEKDNDIQNGAWAYLSRDEEGTLILKPLTGKFQIFSEAIENVTNDDFYNSLMTKSNTYSVSYTKAIGTNGTIIVKAANEQQAIKNAQFSCFTGSNFHSPVLIDNSEYIKPTQQGFAGSHRQNK